jgi:hypothetical protein
MTIRSFALPEETQDKVLDLLSEISLSEYYRSYDWEVTDGRTVFRI